MQRLGRELKIRGGLQNHAILVELGEDGGNLPLTEGVVERVVDCLRQDVEPGCLLAIHHHVGLQSAGLFVAGHVAQLV